MIQLGDLARDMMAEEGRLEQMVGEGSSDLSPSDIIFCELLLAIHKRQRDGIMLGLRTSNG